VASYMRALLPVEVPVFLPRDSMSYYMKRVAGIRKCSECGAIVVTKFDLFCNDCEMRDRGIDPEKVNIDE